MEVHANANRPKLGVIFNIFVEGDKVAAAEILNDVVWHLLEPHQVHQGGSGRWQGLGIRFLCWGQRSIGWLMQRFASSRQNQRKGLGRCQSVFGTGSRGDPRPSGGGVDVAGMEATQAVVWWT
jgi:hypothetical protein